MMAAITKSERGHVWLPSVLSKGVLLLHGVVAGASGTTTSSVRCRPVLSKGALRMRISGAGATLTIRSGVPMATLSQIGVGNGRGVLSRVVNEACTETGCVPCTMSGGGGLARQTRRNEWRRATIGGVPVAARLSTSRSSRRHLTARAVCPRIANRVRRFMLASVASGSENQSAVGAAVTNSRSVASHWPRSTSSSRRKAGLALSATDPLMGRVAHTMLTTTTPAAQASARAVSASVASSVTPVTAHSATSTTTRLVSTPPSPTSKIRP